MNAKLGRRGIVLQCVLMVFLHLKCEGKGQGSKVLWLLEGFCASFRAQRHFSVGHCPLFLMVLLSRAVVV